MLKKFILLGFLFFIFTMAFAETVVLKSGQKIEGKITENTDKYIKINFSGVELTYYKDQIAQIDGKGLVAVAAAPGGDLVAEAMEISGANKIIQEFVNSYNSGLIGAKDKVNAQAQPILDKAALDPSFALELRQAAVDYFSAHLEQDKLKAVIDWFQGPLGMKILDLESKGADTPAAQKELQDISFNLKNNKIPEQRLVLMRKLDGVTNSSEMFIDMVIAAVGTVSLALEPILPENKRLKPGELGRMRSELVVPLNSQVMIGFLFAFRALSDEEITEYIKFCESVSGSWFIDAVGESLKKAFASAGDKIGARVRPAIEEYLKNKQSK
ncbi:MAG: DUF2059 domain-containing protein [Candidatus Omnitrophota bacterium]